MYIFRTQLEMGGYLSYEPNIRGVYNGFLRLLKLDQNQIKVDANRIRSQLNLIKIVTPLITQRMRAVL